MLHAKDLVLGCGAILLLGAATTTGCAPLNAPDTTARRPVGRELLIPADPSLNKLVVMAAFPVANRDPDDQFGIQPFEADKATELMRAQGDVSEFILGAQGHFVGAAPRLIELVDPAGKPAATTSGAPGSKVVEWQAGKAWVIAQPAPGTWKLTVQGSGKYNVYAQGSSARSMLSEFDFINLEIDEDLQIRFKDPQPASGAEYIGAVWISEPAQTGPALRLLLRNEKGDELAEYGLHFWERAEVFGAVFKIPGEPFRVGIRGKGSDGFAYERFDRRVWNPQGKPSPYTAEDIRRFKADPDEVIRALLPGAVGGVEIRAAQHDPSNQARTMMFTEAGGAARDLSDYKGKVLVIGFFNTWCDSCQAAALQMRALQERFGNQGVKVLWVSAYERGDPRKWMTEHGCDYDLIRNGAGMARQYKVDRMPTFVVLGVDGSVIYRHDGLDRDGVEKIASAIEKHMR